MVSRLRFALAALWLATLVAVAVVATSVGGSSAAPRRVVVQPSPADAGKVIFAAPSTVDVTTTTPTTIAPVVTVAPTTTPPTTTAPTTAPATTTVRTPKPVAPTAVRPATVTAPKPVAPINSGTASDFTLIGYRWNPCQTITVTSLGPDINAVVSELATITGLHLKMVTGLAQITVMWGPVPPGGEIGYTAWKATGAWLTQAGVVLGGQPNQPYLSTLLRHELGHALGLGHATRSNEVMYGSVGGSSPTDYQAGDLSGLHAVGASAGC
jgi:hypothetical protein